MPLKFAANISWLFKEAGPLEKRYAAAKAAGFQAVEVGLPYDVPIDVLVKAREEAGVEQVLINSWAGDVAAGEQGLAALPHREQDFREGLEKSIQYCKALHCKRLRIMAGKEPAKWGDTAMEEVLLVNMKYAAKRMEEEDIIGLVEPVSAVVCPKYVLGHPDKCVKLIEKINSPNLKLQLDLFHLQITNGNLTENIKKLLPYTAHMQLAQAPGRHEPTAPGEINFPYVFSVLEEAGYDGWIGLEYNPIGSTDDGIKWLKDWGHW